jgi:oligopeptide/dipeptide ABC transporter ATP-binding protein
MVSDIVLQIQNLTTHFFLRQGVVKALNGVSVQLKRGEILCVVGESGSGKTVMALSIMGIVPYPGKIVSGQVMYQGEDLVTANQDRMRGIRGREISMVFQDPVTGLNPVVTVGEQVEEAIRVHRSISKREARKDAMEALHNAGLPEPKRIFSQYPFQLSGGMCQRVMLAMAMVLKPKILIADEPTSSLDVTMQAQIMREMRRLRDEVGTSVILITHDMGIVAQMADEVAVMYGGSLMEFSDTTTLFKRPTNPYTWSLLQTIARIDQPDRPLRQVPGNMPNLLDMADQCPFLSRCPKARNECRTQPRPPLEHVGPNHLVACYNRIYHDPE